MSVIASVVVVAGFCALWLVANELEDPFGFDPNGAFVSGVAVLLWREGVVRGRAAHPRIAHAICRHADV
eukprot:546579-Prymnesium_polylepis.1